MPPSSGALLIQMHSMNIFIRFNANQVGLNIEASKDGKDWKYVELQKWKSYPSPTVMQYSSCIDTQRQQGEYLSFLRGKGMLPTVVN